MSKAAQVVAKYMPQPDLPGNVNNYFSKAAATWPYYNTTTPLIKIDHSISTKQKLQGSFTKQTRPRIIWSGGLTNAPAWGQPQTNPLDNVFDQEANSWKIRINHDYIFSPNLLNHITLSTDRYVNLGINKTGGQGWSQQLGITGIPADKGEFPQIAFSGGAVSPAQLNRAYDEVWFDLRYSIIENMTWIHGKHTVKFGMEIDRDWVNRSFFGNASGSFGFSNGATSQPTSPSYGSWGNSYASFILGAVNTASAYIPVAKGTRVLRFAGFVQDEWRVAPNLTISYGLRYDYMPPYREVNNRLSGFVPTIANSAAGGRMGALGFAGTGPGRVGDNFVDPWKKGFGPRLGVSYQLNPKTVLRASSGIYYAQWGANQYDVSSDGFTSSPSFSSADGYTPLINIGPGGTGLFPQDFTRPPSLDPTFDNGLSIAYPSRSGNRLPQTISWTASIQRELASNLSVEAVYLGSRTTHLAYTANYNYMDISGLQYGSTLLKSITSPEAARPGSARRFPGLKISSAPTMCTRPSGRTRSTPMCSPVPFPIPSGSRNSTLCRSK